MQTLPHQNFDIELTRYALQLFEIWGRDVDQIELHIDSMYPEATQDEVDRAMDAVDTAFYERFERRAI